MIIIYTAKPFMTRQLVPLVLEQFPNQQLVFLHSLYFSNLLLDYPKDIKWKQFPYLQAPEFKLNDIEKWRATTLDNKDLLPIDISMQDIAQKCEKIFYMAEPGYHDTYSFSIFFEKVFNIPVEKTHIDAIMFHSLLLQEINEAWNKKGNFHDMFQKQINYGKVVRYFDYNFNFNSFALLGKLYKHLDNNFTPNPLGKNNDFKDIFLSKNMIQLLYFIKKQEIEGINFIEGGLIQKMSNWKGTGKYNFKAPLGSAASRLSILENLVNLELIKMSRAGTHMSIFMTEKGIAFLHNLPKDCMDFDLPFRIKLWAEQPFETSKLKIDNYLNNYYKKIKNRLKTLQI